MSAASSTRKPKRVEILRDPKDIRDLIYRPALGVLPDHFLCAAVDPLAKPYSEVLKRRNQEARSSCIGEALAALIDIQRIDAHRHFENPGRLKEDVRPASAAMLHSMALEIESLDFGRAATEVYSLRSGLKGFYNTGVCSADTWARRPLHADGDAFDTASVVAMKEAKSVTLGAYYRVRSFINDYHAALVEVGALYVSAEIHAGWRNLKEGTITKRPSGNNALEGHAFVIVGYEEKGFLVLNSWGEDWGLYQFVGRESLPGIALWPYEDWADHVLDAWVLRLAVPTPEAFRFAVGPQGSAMFGADQPVLAAPSIRRMAVLGRYIHLEDGYHVKRGAYPSSQRSIQTTLDYLASPQMRSVRDIRITLHGDVIPTAEALLAIATGIAADKHDATYGISFLWINTFLSRAALALKPLFDAESAFAGGNRDDADARIEEKTRPIGRALWRDVHRAAELSTGAKGDATRAFRSIVAMCRKADKRLHLVAEGVGALLLAALLDNKADPRSTDDLGDVLASLTLVSPMITKSHFDAAIGVFLLDWLKRTGLRATIFRPDKVFDDRLCVGAYSRSWTDLVARAFEDRPTPLVGAHGFRGRLRGDPKMAWLKAPERPSGDLSSTAVLQHASLRTHASNQLRRE